MRKWIPLFIIAVVVVGTAVVYPKLPESFATHWDGSGQPNGWSGRLMGAWMLPILMVVVWGFLRVLPAIDPRGSNYAKFGGAFEAIIVSIMLFLLGIQIVILRGALGYPMPIQRVAPIGVGVFLTVIGILLPRARPNWFVGIRTPWTLSSDRVWEKTHRLGGHVFVVGGLLIVLAALLSAQWAQIVLVTVTVLCTAIVLIYSYVEWKREQSTVSAPR